LNSTILYGQNFDLQLKNLTKRFAAKINEKDSMDIAVYPFYGKKRITEASRLVYEDFRSYLNQFNKHFKIVDREYMEEMLREHQLNQEGLINPATAKQFGMMIAADAYITGKVFIFNTYLRVRLYLIDTETGESIASEYGKIPLEEDIAVFLGINDLQEKKKEAEQLQNDNPDCANKKLADVCFINRSNKTFNVSISSSYYQESQKISLNPGEKKCFENIRAYITYHYLARPRTVFLGDILPKGVFDLTPCSVENIVIR
jgi:TolB-like protein